MRHIIGLFLFIAGLVFILAGTATLLYLASIPFGAITPDEAEGLMLAFLGNFVVGATALCFGVRLNQP